MPPKRTVDPNVAQVNYQTYMGQVLARLPPVIVESLYDIYSDAIEFCKREREYSEADRFRIFQRLLKEIAEWEEDEIAEETERFISAVPWLRSAVQQILISQVHILMSVRNDQYVSRPKFVFDMPREEVIVHRLLKGAARKIRSRVKLFDHTVDEYESETNLLAIEEIVRKSIESEIHALVPLDKIVDAQFGKKTAARRKKAAAATKKKAAAEAEPSGDEGDSQVEVVVEEEISHSEIDNLEEKAVQYAEFEEEKEREKELMAQKLQEKSGSKNKLQLLEGEEHVDDMIERLSRMKKNDPHRSELRQKLKRYLASDD